MPYGTEPEQALCIPDREIRGQYTFGGASGKETQTAFLPLTQHFNPPQLVSHD